MQRYTPPKRRNDDAGCQCEQCRSRARGLSDKLARKMLLGKLDSLIDRDGFAVQGVLGTHDQLPFAYTVGLFLQGLPECIMVGPPPEVTQPLLNKPSATKKSEKNTIVVV